MKKKITIHINENVFHFQEAQLEPHEFRDAVHAPDDYEIWLVIKTPDPEGELPIDDVQITRTTEIKSGQHYRVVPPGTFGEK